MLEIRFTFGDWSTNDQLVKDFSKKVYTQFIKEKTRDPLVKKLLNLEGCATIQSRRNRRVCHIFVDSWEVENIDRHALTDLCIRIHGHMTYNISGRFPEFAHRWFETRVTASAALKEEAYSIAERL